MADIALFGAVLLAAVGVLLGSRSSIVLLFNLGLSTMLQALHVEFDITWWIAIDVLMMVAIWRPALPRTDVAILALYPVIWLLYQVSQPWQFWTVYAAVICQLLLSVPWLKVWYRARRTPVQHRDHLFDDFLRVQP